MYIKLINIDLDDHLIKKRLFLPTSYTRFDLTNTFIQILTILAKMNQYDKC